MITFHIAIAANDPSPDPAVMVGQVVNSRSYPIVLTRLNDFDWEAGCGELDESAIYSWLESQYVLPAPHGAIEHPAGSVTGFRLFTVDYDGDEPAPAKVSYCEHSMFARGRCGEMACWNYVEKHRGDPPVNAEDHKIMVEALEHASDLASHGSYTAMMEVRRIKADFKKFGFPLPEKFSD